jgi:hypothetical protein
LTTSHSGTTTRRFFVYCKTCKKSYEATNGQPCDGCGIRFTVEQPNYLQLQAKLYGTDAVPKWSTELGAWTKGKSHRREVARRKKLIPADADS